MTDAEVAAVQRARRDAAAKCLAAAATERAALEVGAEGASAEAAAMADRLAATFRDLALVKEHIDDEKDSG